ncbi:MAG: ribonuclease inhibitor [Chitinophagaceae bacterium]|nr:MAG: ribonuclease inhibitor [Chitinophagaceae bacterium]
MLLTLAEWAAYLGHYHPVVVHLPIGVLIIAFILEIVGWRSKSPQLDPAIRISLLVGFFSAVIACLFGWFLKDEGGYPETTLFLHQWMGIGVALLTGLCWLMKKQFGRIAKATKIYRSLFIFLIILLTVTGHYGGNMTHGDDYLTAGMPEPVSGWLGIQGDKKDSAIAMKPIEDINQAFVYADLVVPILSNKCYQCHSSSKIKGGLRLDEERLIFKGGKHGSVVTAGDPLASELIKRLTLPMEDDKRMPPKDEPQLSSEEVALLTWWVKAGADTKKKVVELGPDSLAMQLLRGFAKGGGGQPSVPEAMSAVYAQAAPPAKEADLEPLLDLGVLISPVAKEKNLLELSCINYPGFDDSKTGLLGKLSGQLVWLRMDNTGITDRSMEQLALLKNLVRLNLSGTKITGAGIVRLACLTNLEYLNLTGTGLDDQSLAALSKIKSLKNIYCWNTSVTSAGAAAFKKTNPGVVIDNGDSANGGVVKPE